MTASRSGRGPQLSASGEPPDPSGDVIPLEDLLADPATADPTQPTTPFDAVGPGELETAEPRPSSPPGPVRAAGAPHHPGQAPARASPAAPVPARTERPRRAGPSRPVRAGLGTLLIVVAAAAAVQLWRWKGAASAPPPRTVERADAPAAPPAPKLSATAAAPREPATRVSPDRAPPPGEEPLYAGRTSAWWRDRLLLLRGRADAEGQRLVALTSERAARNGLALVERDGKLVVEPGPSAGARP